MSHHLQLLEFVTKDDLILPGLLFEPEIKSKKVAIYLHGNGSSSVFYSVKKMNILGRELNKADIAFFPFNNRGAHWFKKLATTDSRKNKVLYGMSYELIKECSFDIEGAINYLKTLSYETFYLIGASTGANKIVNYHYLNPKNDVTKYILLSGGDDTGLYFENNCKKNKKTFFQRVKKSKEQIDKGHGKKLIPKNYNYDTPISYQSLYDTVNPDGDYNIFPFNEYLNNLKLSKKPLFSEFKSLNKPTLVIYGENDEYCYGNVSMCVEILKKECDSRDLFTFKIVPGADHGFDNKEEEMAQAIVNWL